LKRKFDSQRTKTDEMQNEMQVLEQKTSLLLLEKTELNQLVDILNDDEIVTFENGRYCNEVRETIMELLSLNVSMNKVNEVIHTVIQKLTKKSVGRLPSNAVKSRLLLKARHLAHVQVAEGQLSTW
jgi:transcriptional regulator NrdR family protein